MGCKYALAIRVYDPDREGSGAVTHVETYRVESDDSSQIFPKLRKAIQKDLQPHEDTAEIAVLDVTPLPLVAVLSELPNGTLYMPLSEFLAGEDLWYQKGAGSDRKPWTHVAV